MTNQIAKLARVALILGLLSFTLAINAEILYVVNSQSRTLSRIDTATDGVQNNFATLGNVPNKVVVDSDYLWVVNSGDNAIQKISRSTGATLSNILVGIGSNPWDAILHNGFLYVTGLFTGIVYRINTTSGQVTGTVNVGTAPEALHVIGNKLYVSNAGNYALNYAGSSVSVIDLDTFTVLSTIPVNANPQYLANHNGMLHVSCTGNWTDIGGAICIIDPSTDTLVHTIDMGGTPGGIWMQNSGNAIVADSNGANLYRYHPETFALINGNANPIPNGGSEVLGNSGFVAVLSPNWGVNGTVKILHPDLSNWKQYTVAMMPTDMKMQTNSSDITQETIPNAMMVAYPNPVKRGGVLTLKGFEAMDNEIFIFNVKGQKVAKYHIQGKSLSLPNLTMPAGMYFYKIAGSENKSKTGSFVIK